MNRRYNEDKGDGAKVMKWSDVRNMYPNQFVKLKSLSSYIKNKLRNYEAPSSNFERKLNRGSIHFPSSFHILRASANSAIAPPLSFASIKPRVLSNVL